MVRVCGKLGSRVCGLLGSVCGSVGLAVLVVALAALATRHAYAEDDGSIVPIPIVGDCPFTDRCTPCNFPCDDICFGSGRCGPNFCRCVKSNNRCKCIDK
jgi:hypothetical protein